MKRKMKDNQKNIFFSIVFNVVLLAVSLVFFQVHFDIPDDALFARNINDGLFEILYINHYLVRVIKLLQDVIYPINAYTVINIVLSYFSMVSITYVLTDKFDMKKSAFMTGFIYCIFGSSIYNTISFTRLPAIISLAGFMLIIHFAKQKNGFFGMIIGIVLCVLSSMYRYNVFLLVLGVSCVFVFSLSINEYFDKEKTERKFVDFFKILFEPKRIVAALVVFVVAFSCNNVSKMVDKSTEEMQYYAQYTSLRSAVWDYQLPDYENYSDEYDKIDIDENDLAMLRLACFDDLENSLTIEKLQGLNSLKKHYYQNDINSILRNMKQVVIYEISMLLSIDIEFISLTGFGLVIVLYLLTNNKKKFFAPLLMISAVGVCFLYMWYINRTVFRANYAFILSATTYLMYLFDFSNSKILFKNRTRKIITTICIAAISVTGLIASQSRNKCEKDYPLSKEDKQFVEYMTSHTNNKYGMIGVESFYIGLIDNIDDAFHIEKTDYDLNCFVAAGMFYRSPAYNYLLEQFGTDNFYEYLLEDNVYLVVDNDNDVSEVVKTYLEKHYADGKTVDLTKIDTFGKYIIYNCTV